MTEAQSQPSAPPDITSEHEHEPELSPLEEAKRKAAYRAVEDHFPPDAHYVGIGSGSTVVYVVEAIAAMGPAVTSKIVFVPTGFQSRELIVEAGLPLGAIDSLVPLSSPRRKTGGALRVATGRQDLGLEGERVMLDVAFDGADEVDEELNCIKGGGACLFQEKLVATSAKKFVCVADYRKSQPRLLTKWPTVPIEIVPPSAPTVLRTLKLLGSPTPYLRLGGASKAGPVVTDNGNFIVDAPFPALLLPSDIVDESQAAGLANARRASIARAPPGGRWEVVALAKRLREIVGVVETGIFAGRNGEEAGEEGGGQKPVAAYFGLEGGDVVVRRAKKPESVEEAIVDER
ncbi:MAG: ribose-5-phosphate isomerase rki1 [Piccolia ochrophora]|nr:MAG: ribose-5-phosphate isomerase rki1 [Piccolia ochrophora]